MTAIIDTPESAVIAMRFAYADPPYFGCGASHYGEHHDDAAVWDDEEAHLRLVDRLVTEFPDGWALSCNPRDLGMYLHYLGQIEWPAPGASEGTITDPPRVAAWCKTWHQIRPTTVQYAWEPVIFVGGRKDGKRSPMVRDWMACAVTRQTGLKGAKPAEFNQWVLDLLNFRPEVDEIVDLFPGTGGMSRTLEAPPLPFANGHAETPEIASLNGSTSTPGAPS